jgi:hypothetical protein
VAADASRLTMAVRQDDVAGDRAYGRVDVAAHVGQSQADTWHVLIGKKGCHVAHSGAATWHPIIGSLVSC